MAGAGGSDGAPARSKPRPPLDNEVDAGRELDPDGQPNGMSMGSREGGKGGVAGSRAGAGGGAGSAGNVASAAGMGGMSGAGGTAPASVPQLDPDALVGTWFGEGMDASGPVFTLCAKLERLDVDERSGAVDYKYRAPRIRCVGDVTLDSVGENSLEFRERVMGAGCTQLGRVVAKVNDNSTLRWEWYGVNAVLPLQVALLSKTDACP